ncbi:MAG TPA: hypothetical protein V6D14_27320 [Coleofasciculaceae cyanobacterium]|jgi:hypothetical protein
MRSQQIVARAPIFHLFDQETLDSLLMMAHPDWQCTPKDINLVQQLLAHSLEKVSVA